MRLNRPLINNNPGGRVPVKEGHAQGVLPEVRRRLLGPEDLPGLPAPLRARDDLHGAEPARQVGDPARVAGPVREGRAAGGGQRLLLRKSN